MKIFKHVQDGRGKQDVIDARTTALALSHNPICMTTTVTINVGAPSCETPESTEGVSDSSARHYLYEQGTDVLKVIEVDWLAADNVTAETATWKPVSVITGDSIKRGIIQLPIAHFCMEGRHPETAFHVRSTMCY